LVFINIIVIFIAAILVFYLKDAIPHETELEDWKAATSLKMGDMSYTHRRRQKGANKAPQELANEKTTQNGGSKQTQQNGDGHTEFIPPTHPSAVVLNGGYNDESKEQGSLNGGSDYGSSYADVIIARNDDDIAMV
jgi:hypothetical protein